MFNNLSDRLSTTIRNLRTHTSGMCLGVDAQPPVEALWRAALDRAREAEQLIGEAHDARRLQIDADAQ